MKKTAYIFFYFLLGIANSVVAQDVDLFQQFNGRYNYIAIGNTLNPSENNISEFCTILDTSEAMLTLDQSSTTIKAYLYWAGSGLGDSEVTLNGTSITAIETYNVFYNDTLYGELSYFSCYADITEQIINEGNGNYQFSNADINTSILSNEGYCSRKTNFGGWSIYVIYESNNLPLNQISLYQGLEIINRNVPEIELTLTNINVLDNEGAKIGFLAWEGDNSLNFGESLSINNSIISNPPLNLADNAFNGTNTFINSNTFYNGDLDVYNIENNISIGDTEVSIKLTTGDFDNNGIYRADLIIINNIITVLNSQLPDATIQINNETINCGDNNIELFYTVANFNSTALLPSGTPIAFYANDILIGQSETINNIQINSSESNFIILTIPENLGSNINITVSIDDDANMNSTVPETNEANNTTSKAIELLIIPDITILPRLLECNKGFEIASYNLHEALEGHNINLSKITFYNTLNDLENEFSPINTPTSYNNVNNPDTIYARLESSPCYEIFQFQLTLENCPPFIPDGFSPNNDTYNDWFNIQGLYNIFINHKLKIYNRYGNKIFEGDNDKPWLGKINKGINNNGGFVPVGPYYYILFLNDPNYKPLKGWVYVNY